MYKSDCFTKVVDTHFKGVISGFLLNTLRRHQGKHTLVPAAQNYHGSELDAGKILYKVQI